MRLREGVSATVVAIGGARLRVRPSLYTLTVKQSELRFSTAAGSRLRTTLIFALVALVVLCGCRNKTHPQVPAPATLDSASSDQFKQAALRVEEDRGEPMGRQAKVEVPLQLKHYPDTRRFLSLQIAEWRKQELQTPHDFAELASLIKRGELIAVPALGKAYILYGVGLSATDGPFTHYDKESGESVPLIGSDAELQQEYADIEKSLDQLKQTEADLRKQLAAAPRRDRELARKLRTEIIENERSEAAFKKTRALLNRFYKNAESRAVISDEYNSIAVLSLEYGQGYSLTDANGRKALKVRLLSYLRPAALRVMEDLAKVYQDKFGRPLAITSLVRPDEYQHQLRESNPNATLIDVPPHSTGLAFDVYYRYMTAAEQQFVMAELARLRDEGRIAVLRENANHFHVFVFIDGTPPAEELITRSLDEVGPTPKTAEAEKGSARKRRATTSKRANPVRRKSTQSSRSSRSGRR